jgi:serine protease
VRALGKCFGTDSDIMSAMLWAGGIHVGGAPDNPYPAKVENLSIGAEGDCGAAYQNVISQLAARGVLVVVSAGNEGGPVDSPANCPGVVGVAGLRHAGTKVGYSSLGPEITVGAPAGNCVNTSGPCLRPINTTSNGGSQGAAAYTYTDTSNANLGTSFSAPIVSAIAGLMVSANGNLTTTQLIERLKEGASKPFPASADGTVPVCHVPSGDGDVQNSECNCTTDTCGAGMANARGAVTAALRPTATATTSFGSNTFTLSGQNSSAAPGSVVAGYLWEIACGSATLVGSSSGATTSVAPPTDGTATVRLTVTDDAGRIDIVNVALTATTASQVPSGADACPVSVQISPSTAAVTAGASVAFVATVNNTTNKAVTWQVDGVPGGSGTSGTITADGVFTAPATVAAQTLVTVKAVWSGDPTRTATASVTLQATATPSSSSGGGGGGGGGGATDGALLAVLAIGVARRRCAARNSS